ncbi:hypothetical protein ES705_29768 [subsurface metagenome]
MSIGTIVSLTGEINMKSIGMPLIVARLIATGSIRGRRPGRLILNIQLDVGQRIMPSLQEM